MSMTWSKPSGTEPEGESSTRHFRYIVIYMKEKYWKPFKSSVTEVILPFPFKRKMPFFIAIWNCKLLWVFAVQVHAESSHFWHHPLAYQAARLNKWILFSFNYFLILCVMAPNRAIASNAREESSGFCNMHVRKDRRFRLQTPSLLCRVTWSVRLLRLTRIPQTCLQSECPFTDKAAFKCCCPAFGEIYKVSGELFVRNSCSKM